MIPFEELSLIENYRYLQTRCQFFRRGRESTLENHNEIYYENEIVCTLPDDDASYEERQSIDYLKARAFRYKIGDGIHHWKDLPYEPGLLPIATVGVPPTQKRFDSLEEAKAFYLTNIDCGEVQ